MNDTTFQVNGKIAYVPVVVNTKMTKQSNADRIRSMSDEELAKFITSGYYQPRCPVESCPVVEDCEDCWLRWLKAEVEE